MGGDDTGAGAPADTAGKGLRTSWEVSEECSLWVVSLLKRRSKQAQVQKQQQGWRSQAPRAGPPGLPALCPAAFLAWRDRLLLWAFWKQRAFLFAALGVLSMKQGAKRSTSPSSHQACA